MTPSISPTRDKGPNVRQSPCSASSSFFIRLPPEVLELIVSYACRSPPPSTSPKAASKRSPLALDSKTTLNLSLTSKSLHALISLILLENVRLTRLSSLIELNRTLDSNPALGELIKSLHVGTETESLAAGEWPLLKEDEEEGVKLRYSVLWIKTSFGEDEEGKLPKWCEPDRSWCFEPGRLDCQGVASTNAIKAAMDALDVEPYRRGYARNGEKIGLVSAGGYMRALS